MIKKKSLKINTLLFIFHTTCQEGKAKTWYENEITIIYVSFADHTISYV